ncbi:TPA: hypothetical protein SG783_000029 [Campylobacter coli]|nr:hypothetical protein [Campylobacter coli]HEH4644374.1 hypothetical protein [Campylobacter coli]HEH4982366.1 hypothetical protein [Campylobacter coli]HEH4988826.1 hypothetical protein [Campylobacter coli]HEH5121324.1 hypothetical protein [Campylobacter coli]
MKILLLNENPVVSRLISLSAKKMSYDFEEINTYDENLGHYDVIIVDSDTPAPLKILKEKCDKLIFLAPRNQSVDIEAQILHKPFLPTDFLNLLNQENLKIDDSIVLPIDESENPYADISLDLDSLNLDDLPDENNNAQESDFSLEEGLESLTLDDMEEEASQKEIASENIDEELNLDDLSLDEEQEGDNSTSEQVEVSRLEEKHEEALEALSQDDILNDEFSEEKEEELETQEQDVEEQDKIEDIQELEDKTVDLDNDLSQNDEISNTQEISIDDVLDAKEETQPDVLKEEEPDKTQVQDFVADDFLIVEEQETELDFDDIPEDAEFLGQAKEEDEAVEDFLPVVEDQENLDEHDEFEEMSNLSTQDQIKEELAQLDELEYDIDSDDSIKVLEDFKEEPILDDKDLPSNDEEVIVPKLEINDFDSLKESDIQAALGEEISTLKDNKNEKLETKEEQLTSETSEEIVNELSQSIAGAITSSIKDDTLKAALKGMNMNINISISFNEDKN